MKYGNTKQIRECSSCGKKDYEYKMLSYYTGRRHWICTECYKHGVQDVTYKKLHKRQTGIIKREPSKE